MALTIVNDTKDGIYRAGEIIWKNNNNREISFTGSGESAYVRLPNNRNFTFALISNGATTYKLQYTVLEFKEGITPKTNDFLDSGLSEQSNNGGNISANITGFRIVANGNVKVQFNSLY